MDVKNLPPPGSHSNFEVFKTCPHQYYRKYIKRDVRFVPGEAAKWGTEVHAAMEDAIKAKGALMPSQYRMYQHWVQAVVDAKGGENAIPEQKMAMTRAAKPAKFFDTGTWFRGITDVIIPHSKDEMSIIDWKTGKVYADKARLQSDKMAMLTFVNYPDVQVIHSRFVFLKFKKTESFEYTRKDLSTLLTHTAHEYAAIEWASENEAWPKQQNGLCRNWCDVMDCNFNGRRG